MPLSTGKKIALGCAVAGAGIAVVVALAAAFLVRHLSVSDIEVALEGPAVVERGETFDLTVRVRNRATRPQTVVDIDVAGSYLAGLLVDGTEPPHGESMGIPFSGGTSYTFDMVVEPGSERVFLFHLTALREGDYSGDVDVCVNSSVAFVTKVARTVVEGRSGTPGELPARPADPGPRARGGGPASPRHRTDEGGLTPNATDIAPKLGVVFSF